jgi:hypothetical protein
MPSPFRNIYACSFTLFFAPGGRPARFRGLTPVSANMTSSRANLYRMLRLAVHFLHQLERLANVAIGVTFEHEAHCLWPTLQLYRALYFILANSMNSFSISAFFDMLCYIRTNLYVYNI